MFRERFLQLPQNFATILYFFSEISLTHKIAQGLLLHAKVDAGKAAGATGR